MIGRMTTAYLALGSNLDSDLGDRKGHLEAACAMLDATSGVKIAAVSSFIENPSVGGPADAPDFLNGVAAIETDLPPRELLDLCLQIERARGRERTGEANAPRTLDVDVLLYGDQVIHEDGLVVPHPRLHKRRFVLKPLAEIAPELVHPTIGKTMSELLDSIDNSEAEG